MSFSKIITATINQAFANKMDDFIKVLSESLYIKLEEYNNDPQDLFDQSKLSQMLTQTVPSAFSVFDFDSSDKNTSKSKKISKSKKSDSEKKPRKPTGYACYAKANRDAIKQANPTIGFAEINKALGDAWKALDAESKKQWNDDASSAYVESKCDFDGCTAKGMMTKYNDCMYCKDHLKEIKKEETKKLLLEKTDRCVHRNKTGDQCVARVEKGETKCGKHKPRKSKSKKSDSEEKPEVKSNKTADVSETKPEVKSEKNEVKETKKATEEFDFANAVVPTISEDDEDEPFWTFKKVRVEGEIYRRHPETGLVLELDADVLVGYVSKGVVKVDNIPEKIKKFAKKAGIKLQPVKAVLSDDE